MRTFITPRYPFLMASRFQYPSTFLICALLSACALVLLYFDPYIQIRVTHLGENELFRQLMDGWRMLGEEFAISAFLLCGVYFGLTKRNKVFVWFVTSLLGVAVLVHGIKHLVSRARPTTADPQNVFCGPLAYFRVPPEIKIDSMPSGHTAAAFVMASCLSGLWPRLTWLWFSLAIGVGISRVVTNAHFSSDVFIGAAIGILVSEFMMPRFEQCGMYGTADLDHECSIKKECS